MWTNFWDYICSTIFSFYFGGLAWSQTFFVNLEFFWHNAKMALFYYSEHFAKSPFRVVFSKLTNTCAVIFYFLENHSWKEQLKTWLLL